MFAQKRGNANLLSRSLADIAGWCQEMDHRTLCVASWLNFVKMNKVMRLKWSSLVCPQEHGSPRV